MTTSTLRFGPLTVDESGIAQRRLLPFLGNKFVCRWLDLVSWSVATSWRQSQANGERQLLGYVLELRCKEHFHTVPLPPDSAIHVQLLDVLQRQAPDKAVSSVLEQIAAARGGGR
jgi:hypothetical protein